MAIKVPSWESEFWSYINDSDGVTCPMYPTCKYRLLGYSCLCENGNYSEGQKQFLDSDDLETSRNMVFSDFHHCFMLGKIFLLGRMLAVRYRNKIKYHHSPVESDLTIENLDDVRIEVRQVSLKNLYGAVWQIGNLWVIQLNSNNTIACQRFTLYHEIFHVLAHHYSNPIFKKPFSTKGLFNEILADHFAAISLMPRKMLTARWGEVKDVNQMSAIFNVPKPIMYRALQILKLL